MDLGPVNLLIIQGTPFCNIDCKYCYLPNRSDNKKISIITVEKIIDRLMESNLIRSDFTMVWHAGEPLVMPLEFYKTVVDLVKIKNNSQYKIRQNFQTNATLITDEWCVFFKENDVQVSVSIDGPEFIHDRYRITRKGKGTFESVMKGLSLLQKHEIKFSIISVVTDFTLDYASEFYDFFINLNPKSLGINIEEIEGSNSNSTLYNNNIKPERYCNFIDKLFSLYITDKRKLPIREFIQLETLILKRDSFMTGLGQQTVPFRIITVDINGNFSTFSPEMLNMKSGVYGDFIMGNVYENSFETVVKSKKFDRIYSDILEGIVMCKKECDYFSVCGGGTPSNKYSELNSFAVTETNHCRFKFQRLFDTVLNRIEDEVYS